MDTQEVTTEATGDTIGEITDFRENLIDVLEHIAEAIEGLTGNATLERQTTADDTYDDTLHFGAPEDIADFTNEKTQIPKKDV